MANFNVNDDVRIKHDAFTEKRFQGQEGRVVYKERLGAEFVYTVRLHHPVTVSGPTPTRQTIVNTLSANLLESL